MPTSAHLWLKRSSRDFNDSKNPPMPPMDFHKSKCVLRHTFGSIGGGFGTSIRPRLRTCHRLGIHPNIPQKQIDDCKHIPSQETLANNTVCIRVISTARTLRTALLKLGATSPAVHPARVSACPSPTARRIPVCSTPRRPPPVLPARADRRLRNPRGTLAPQPPRDLRHRYQRLFGRSCRNSSCARSHPRR